MQVTTTAADCNGGATGTIDFVVTGGIKPYYFYIIKGGVPISSPQTMDTVYTFQNVVPGTYVCMVQDSNADADLRTRTVGQPASLSISSAIITPISCSGYTDGKIDIIATGESGSYDFLLQPLNISSTTGSYSGLDQGSYRVIVSDATGCTGKDSTGILELTNPLSIIITGENSTDLSCNGSNNGSISITASGGTGSLNYTISPGGASNSTGIFNNLLTGTYTVDVTDSNSCPDPTSSPITITEPPLLQFTSQQAVNASCSGVNDGSITVSASGGTAPYTFTLSPGGTINSTGIFTNLAPGSYSVNLSDSKSCGPVAGNNLTISQPAAIAITGTIITQISCNNSNNGEITVTASGGNTPLTYTLNPGAVSNLTGVFQNLSGGTYTVTVTDAKACNPATTAPVIITNPNPISITSQINTNIGCNGQNNGTISITAEGGTGALLYTLNPGAISQANGNFTGLAANTYTISVTDQNICPAANCAPVTITEPSLLQFTSQQAVDASCNGVNDGSITVSASGGIAPYSFTLSPGGTINSTGIFTNLAPGSYSVNLSDSKSCGPVAGNNLTISQPAAITITGTIITQISCNNSNNGEITVTGSGGNAPLTYTLNPGAISNLTGVFQNLSGGTYTVSVSDAKACNPATTAPVIITNPNPISITSQIHTNIGCNGQNNGTISITAEGGTGALLYTLNPGAISQANGNFTGLSANTYTVSVTDQKLCPAANSAPVSITEPSLLQFTSQQAVDASCSGLNDGSITVSASGGTAPYTFTLSPGGTANSTGIFANLVAGSYSVSLSDSKSCGPVAGNNLTISQPEAIIITGTTITQISCNNSNNGEITVTASGGNAPLTYTLNPGAISNLTGVFQNLSGGTYTVSVSDTKTCNPAVTTPVIITNPNPISITSQIHTNINCNGQNNGTISIIAEGGTGALVYTLNPGAISQANGNFTGLAANTYTISVTDQNLCPAANSAPVTIIEPLPLSASADSTSRLSASCFGDSDGIINITVSGGTAPYEFAWTGPNGYVSNLKDLTGLAPGIYNLSVTDSNLCTSVNPGIETIIEPEVLQMSLTKTDISCYGIANGTITINASGGTAPYQYSRNGIVYQSSNVFSNLAQNKFTLRVRDNYSCMVSDTISIIEPKELLISSEINISENKCYGDSLGEIRILAVTGGNKPYEYSINGGLSYNSSPIFLNLPAGSYQTKVRDANACITPGSTHIISQPARLRITSYAQTDVTICSDNTNGQIAIEVSGGTGTKLFSLDGVPTNSTGIFSAVSGGSHILSITDENNCRRDTMVNLSYPAPIEFTSLVLTNVTGCNGNINGAISTTVSGGAGNYEFNLNGGSFQTQGEFSGLSAGIYTLNIKDDNNCVKDTSLTITQPAPLSFGSVIVNDISCAGMVNGNIEAIPQGGTMPYIFTLNPGGSVNSTGIFAGLSQGTYVISLNDSAGCGPVVSAPIIITEPESINRDSVSISQISCTGENNGQITILASGGSGTLEYSIDDGNSFSNNNLFTGLAPGTYHLSFQDTNSCLAIIDTILIIDPAPYAILFEASEDVNTCNGDFTGSVNFEVIGGTGAILYSIDGIIWQASGAFNNLEAGVYTVIAKDEMNCNLTSSNLLINEPDTINAEISSTLYKDELNKGSITILNSTGGTGVFEFSVNGISGPFSNDTVFTGLDDGTWQVVIKDQNNCTYSEEIIISSIPPLDVNLITTNATCYGSDNGSIVINALNPEGMIEYSIDDSASWYSSNSFDSLSPGAYKVVVRDETGKYFMEEVALTEPSFINIMSSVTPASCKTTSIDGSVIINVSGGTGIKTFLWDDGVTSQDRDSLISGDYWVTVTDENFCESEKLITVSYVNNVIANAGADTSVCEGTILTLNGQGGINVSWLPVIGLSDPNSINPVVTITEPVSYILSASGIDECYDTDTISIGVYPKLNLYAGSDTSVLENNPAYLTATGGPYVSYLWEPSRGLDYPSSIEPVATLPSTQKYIVTAMDENGCTEKDTVTVTVIERLIIYSSFSPNDDGINDFWDIDYADYYPEIIVEVYNRWGERLFSTKGYNPEDRWDGMYMGKNVPIGTYYYAIIPYKGAQALTGTLTIVR